MLLVSIPLLVLTLAPPVAPQPAPVKPPIAVVDLTPADLLVECVRARFPTGLGDAQRDALVQVVTTLRAGDDALASKRWSTFVAELVANGGAIDPNALVQYVLRESYLQTTEDLRFFADKVKYYNTQKKLIREYLQKLRDYDSSMKADASARFAPLQLNETYALFAAPTTRAALRTMDKAAIAAEIAKWEQKLAHLGEISKAAISDLNDEIEKKRDVIARMTSIAKKYYDTARAIIQNIKG